MAQADRVVDTTCPFCGVGCQLSLHIQEDVIYKATGRFDNEVNYGNLCVKGRFGYDFVHSPDRLKVPMMRDHHSEEWREASWDEAMGHVAERLLEIKEKHGPRSIAFLTSAKCTNEENYLLQKLARAVIGTNSVDHCARLCHSSSVAALKDTLGAGAMSNSISDFADADVMIVTGNNTTETHPVSALQLKKAARTGTKLIVADPRRIELVKFSELHLRQRPGTDIALFNGIGHVIIEEGLVDEAFIEERTEGFEQVREHLRDFTPERVSEITGVPAEDIIKTAHLYGEAENAVIFWGMGITQHIFGTSNVRTLINLALMTGNFGRPGTGLNPLRGQNNVQGASDMGGLPGVFSGYQDVTDENVRRKMAEGWGVPYEDLDPEMGFTVMEMMDEIEEGNIKALFVMGENPMLSDPDLTHVREVLEEIEFLVSQDIFMNETGELAHVILPASSFAEKRGTFTNTDRHVQMVRPGMPSPGKARRDWKLIIELANRMGAEWDYQSPAEIMDEVARVTPIYGGITHDRLEAGEGLQWPCPTPDHPGTSILYKEEFSRGLGKFSVVPIIEPEEAPDDEYPYVLSTGRTLYHWHGGTMTHTSPSLHGLAPVPDLEVNPADANANGWKSGDRVMVSSRRGEVEAEVRVTRRSPVGAVFMTFHYPEMAANLLTPKHLDPESRIPSYKMSAVNVEKIPEEEEKAPAAA